MKDLGSSIRENPAKNWGEVTSWEEMLAPEEKMKIRGVLAKIPEGNLCPLLRQIGDGETDWIYCQAELENFRKWNIDTKESEIPSLKDPRYHTSVGYVYFHTFCSDRFGDCACYKEALDREKDS